MRYIIFIAVAPFLFFLHGYCIIRRFQRTYDAIERLILSVFLSLAMIYGGIFAIEKFTDKITAGKVAFVVLGINIICLVVAFARSPQTLRKMQRRPPERDL